PFPYPQANSAPIPSRVSQANEGLPVSVPVISYIRVSTARQGRSRLGLEAQRKALVDFCGREGFEGMDEELQVETGKGGDALDRRPQLAAALAQARRLHCAILVAKLDRLSRCCIRRRSDGPNRLVRQSPSPAGSRLAVRIFVGSRLEMSHLAWLSSGT